MISVKEAEKLIYENVNPAPVEKIDIRLALGRVLQQDILADRDFPPFDRVAMDGIAVSHESIASGNRSFTIAGIQKSGIPQLQIPDNNQYFRLYLTAFRNGKVITAQTTLHTPIHKSLLKQYKERDL